MAAESCLIPAAALADSTCPLCGADLKIPTRGHRAGVALEREPGRAAGTREWVALLPHACRPTPSFLFADLAEDVELLDVDPDEEGGGP